MPHEPTHSRIEHLLSEQLSVLQAEELSQQDLVGEPDAAMITGSAQTIIPANGARLVALGNLSPMAAFLAIDKTAEMGKGIVLHGNTSVFLGLSDGLFLSAISGGGNIDLAWQFFGQS